MADFVTAKEKGEILSAMTLPFLPGNSFDKNVSDRVSKRNRTRSTFTQLHFFSMQLGKSRFHKSHSFDYNADVPVCVGEKKPGIGWYYYSVCMQVCKYIYIYIYCCEMSCIASTCLSPMDIIIINNIWRDVYAFCLPIHYQVESLCLVSLLVETRVCIPMEWGLDNQHG